MRATFADTTPLRAVAAIFAGLLVGVIAAQSLVWSAYSALGAAEWFGLLLDHLQTKWLDFGPGFVLGLLVWMGFHHAGWRHIGYAIPIGALSFYVASRLFALTYLLHLPYWSFNFGLFVPRWGELIVGASVAALMWVIAYWQLARSDVARGERGD